MTETVKDLKPANYNPRKITDKQLLMLDSAMKEFGSLDGIIFNIRTGTLIGGHQRVKCLNPEWEIVKNPHTDGIGTVAEGFIDTPYGHWPYREVDWPLEKEMMANIAANNHGGENDMVLLKDILEELSTSEYAKDGLAALELTGFDEKELKSMIAAPGNKPQLPDICVKIIIVTVNPEQWIVAREEIKTYLTKLIDDYGAKIEYDE